MSLQDVGIEELLGGYVVLCRIARHVLLFDAILIDGALDDVPLYVLLGSKDADGIHAHVIAFEIHHGDVKVDS